MNDHQMFAYKLVGQFERLEGMKVKPLLTAAFGVNVGSPIPVQVFPGLYVVAEYGGVKQGPQGDRWDPNYPLVITQVGNPYERTFLQVKSANEEQDTLPSTLLDFSWFDRRCYAVPFNDPQVGWLFPLTRSVFISNFIPKKDYLSGAPVLLDKIVTGIDGSVHATVSLTSERLPSEEECRATCYSFVDFRGDVEAKGHHYAVGRMYNGHYCFFVKGAEGKTLAAFAETFDRVDHNGKFRKPSEKEKLAAMNLDKPGTTVIWGADGYMY